MLLVNYIYSLTKYLERDIWKKGQTKGISETYHKFWKERLRGNLGNVSLPLTF